MLEKKNVPIIGIIGCGPRGLSALESLYTQASKEGVSIKCIIFEKTHQFGSGPVYNTGQPDSNWLNVAERAVDIWPRGESVFDSFSIPSFPTFQEWMNYDEANVDGSETDWFPPRSKMGEYLRERYDSIAEVLQKEGLLQSVHGEVISAVPDNHSVSIGILGGEGFTVDEAVLTIGHQPVNLDDQLSKWQTRTVHMDTSVLFTDPYPIQRLLESGNIGNTKVAVRGFGLAMIDLARAFTVELGGRFQILDSRSRIMEYIPSGKEPKSIVPFSLDGLPMAPKPLNRVIDAPFVPSDKELEQYTDKILTSIESDVPLNSPKFLTKAITPLVVKKYTSSDLEALEHHNGNDELQSVVERWLNDGNYSHELILPLEMEPTKMMERFVEMATGMGKVSLDYCIGHVWRHCQPRMYKLLSFAPLADELIADIVALDERLKRYSYGPPVDSLQQVLALERAGIIDLEWVNNPDIELNESGWTLSSSGKSITVDTMVNSVLDAPKILKVAKPLPKNLINASLVEPLHDALGIRTAEDGTIIFENSDVNYRLSVLGRLAKGTLIGVDAIAECFGRRSELWAEGVMNRLHNQEFARIKR